MKPIARNCLAWFSGVYLSKFLNFFLDSIYPPAFEKRSLSIEAGEYIKTITYLHPTGLTNQVILLLIFFVSSLIVGFVSSFFATQNARKYFLIFGGFGILLMGYLSFIHDSVDLIFSFVIVFAQVSGYLIGVLGVIKFFNKKSIGSAPSEMFPRDNDTN
jgi:hypothetical protein